MQRTVESVAQFGVLAPLIARPREEGGYEIISGHRRQHAAELAGLKTLPVIVRNMDDDQAVIQMVDSNLQREHILPSERAFAYKMKLEAIKRTAGRPSKNVSQIGTQKRSDQIMAEEMGESRNQIQRFIRFTNLIPELLDLVDQKKISFNPAVELSYLADSEQQDFLEAMQDTQNAPSLSQAQRIKKLSQEASAATSHLRHYGRGKEGRNGPRDHQERRTAQVFSQVLHPETGGRYHSETFGKVAKETPAQSGTLTIWHQSQNTTQKFGGNAYGNQENYVHHHYPAGL